MKLLVLAVVLVVAGLAAVGAFGQQPVPAEPRTSVGTAAVVATAGDKTIDITEAELSAALNKQLSGQPLGSTPMGAATMQRITAQLRNGVLQAAGDAQVGGTSLPMTMSGAMHVDGGRAVVVVDELRAGGVPLPASARAPLQDALQAQVDAEVRRLQIRVTSLTIADGTLRLVGSPV